jgi:DNA-binding transcriptional MerR regulator/methylmalonyl-CoA mutase cobalamin-binding subunit
VERETGLGKDTLRVWERRYNFPQPLRDPNDERLYPSDQVSKLRVIKRLLDSGYRPGKIIHLPLEALQQLAEESTQARDAAAPALAINPEMQHCLDLCKSHQVQELRRRLSQSILQMGLRSFVIDLLAPLTGLIGEAWAAGRMAVFEEHLYTESVKIVLRNAISQIPQNAEHPRDRPRILLTTFPQERHGLGLLMAEALFALEGCHCISLGVQTPIVEIVDASRAQQADIVALSFSRSVNHRMAIDGLTELRSRLPAAVEIWAGGSSPALCKLSVPRIRTMGLLDISASLAEWRQEQAAQQQ